MTSKVAFALAFVAALGVAGPAGTDVWDTAAADDNDIFTRNEITHGFSQVHDLGVQPGPAADSDWYRLNQQRFSSYEVLCDGITGDVFTVPGNNSLLLQRVDNTGASLQNSVSYGVGFAFSLRFANDTPNVIFNDLVRVANAGCGTSCNTQDQYRIRAWETTIAVPRFNNAGAQITFLLLQNPAEDTVSGNAYVWTTAGGNTPVTAVPFTLAARQATVINLASVNGGVANGIAGTLTITHNGHYGQLAVKAVALEPTTGFSFDIPGQHKPVS